MSNSRSPAQEAPLSFSIDGVSYTGTFLGNGTFNEVYKFSKDGRERVLKVPKDQTYETDTALSAPERAVRLAQEVTPALNAELVDVTLLSDGRTLPLWIADFQTSADATLRDAEIAASVLEIYQRTDRVVLDASVTGNFMAVEDPATAQRKILNVDVDQAMRRGSVVSHDFLAESELMRDWLMEPKRKDTVLGSVVLALMDKVFDYSRAELTDVEKEKLIQTAAKAGMEQIFESIRVFNVEISSAQAGQGEGSSSRRRQRYIDGLTQQRSDSFQDLKLFLDFFPDSELIALADN